MNKYFSQLRPMERRLAVAVLVALFLVLNFLFVWPHRSDWDEFQQRRSSAENKIRIYNLAIQQATAYKKLVSDLEQSGQVVAPEDQGINFTRAIQTQSLSSGVAILNTSKQITMTNDQFFVEERMNINVQATDDQLVDFLYKLGSGASMIRVRDLELQPDPPHQHLTANIRLVASYQKNATVKAGTPPARNGSASPNPVKVSAK
jgi:Tfp pilus assembly protein PilO